MSPVDEGSFQTALAHFCQQRTELDNLGRQINRNVERIRLLRWRAHDTIEVTGAVNVIALDQVRIRVELGRLIADTQDLSGLASQLHADFMKVATHYLVESRHRMARLLNLMRGSQACFPLELQLRVDQAISQCTKEINQIVQLINHTASSVAMLTLATGQFAMLAAG